MTIKIILLINFLFIIDLIQNTLGASSECSSPPPMVDPHACCLDPGPNAIAKSCAKLYGLPVPGEAPNLNAPPPSIDSTVCFAECIMKESKFLKNGVFDVNAMTTSIKNEFKNDTNYANVMIKAFTVCSETASKKFEALKKLPIAENIMKSRCDPIPGVILGCTYTEYFKNCPSDRWVLHPMCEAAKKYVRNCVQ
ncbi:general odorant-binding protein 66-like [Condylostylus longicornis]|uniref:general odorant-binding protein 66-like n=1 Tax=Condylostylus longicornis TaxID=2530218 RepID=UPI00244DF7C3|nr:general odorant-binding protein 66-like [Condylostylus longicornis]